MVELAVVEVVPAVVVELELVPAVVVVAEFQALVPSAVVVVVALVPAPAVVVAGLVAELQAVVVAAVVAELAPAAVVVVGLVAELLAVDPLAAAAASLRQGASFDDVVRVDASFHAFEQGFHELCWPLQIAEGQCLVTFGGEKRFLGLWLLQFLRVT